MIDSPLSHFSPFSLGEEKCTQACSLGWKNPRDQKIYGVFLGFGFGEILFNGSLEELFSLLGKMYDWKSCLHPLDFVRLQQIEDFFSWPLEISELWTVQKHTVLEMRALARELSFEEVSLLSCKKLDFTSLRFCKTHGFEMNIFLYWLFENCRFNAQMQCRMIEGFCTFFRRTQTDPEEFLTRYREQILSIVGSKVKLVEFMLSCCYPRYFEALQKRKKDLSGLKKPEFLTLEMDESLEEYWLKLGGRLKSLEDVKELQNWLEVDRAKISFFLEEDLYV